MFNQVVGLMSRISLIISVIPQNRLLIHVDGIEQYPVETIFKYDYESLTHQHHQGHHLLVVDRMYWYIIRSRWKEREFYPHRLFV